MNPLLASLAILVLGHSPSSGTEVNAELISGRWAIQATVDGKSMFFLLGTTGQNTLISSQVSGLSPSEISEPHTIQIGSLTFAGIPAKVLDQGPFIANTSDDPAIGGILSVGFLDRIQLGLDVLAHKWSIWRDRLTSAEARNWVSKTQLWPHTTGESKVDEIKLERTEFGFACPVTVGTTKIKALIDLSVAASFIPPARRQSWKTRLLGEIKSSNMDLYAIPDFAIGSSEPCLCVGGSDPQQLLSDNSDVMYLSLKALRTTKFILDFEGATLYRNAPPPTVIDSMALSDLAGIPLTLADDGLFVGPVSFQRASPITKSLNGYKVVDISGYTPSSLKTLLHKEDTDGLQAFGALVTSECALNIDVNAEKPLKIPYKRAGI